jgi:Leucine-rich repeat (LRR) protein
LSFFRNDLTSTIPSEIGLLTRLRALGFESNQLTSTIPSEIGLLTELLYLHFEGNQLKGKIPSSLCSLTSLVPDIYIDCGEITCASGCCSDIDTGSLCG